MANFIVAAANAEAQPSQFFFDLPDTTTGGETPDFVLAEIAAHKLSMSSNQPSPQVNP